MKHDPILSGKRKSVNVSMDTGIVAAAREIGINLSRVAEAGLREAIKTAQAERWAAEHRDAIEANNAWVEANGLPLAEYRMF